MPVPATDSDILRAFYRNGLNCGAQKVYDELVEKINILQKILPLNVNKKAVDMLELGGHYIGGRDK